MVFKKWSMQRWYGVSLLVRMLLMVYGVWQDATMAVKYTDVDYYVFTDAAEYVTKGQSPYLRSTYRYPPVLAWILMPNLWLSASFGKILFIVADILVGRLIYVTLRRQNYSDTVSKHCALVWLLNPLTATVSSRGNAESVMAYLVLMALARLLEGYIVSAAAIYAVAVHFKIYPITFALPIYLYLGHNTRTVKKTVTNCNISSHTQGFWSSIQRFSYSLRPNKERCVFITVSVSVLGFLTAVCYHMYGWRFVYETYLYHVVRGDIRHNFSPYFYLLYLTSDPTTGGVPLYLRLLVFLPQASLLVAIALRYHRDPPMACFLSVFSFVMANKVCTSQYFLWYLSLLPLIVPKVKMSSQMSACLIGLWFLAQGLWLLPAYLLEFEGANTFLYVWAASLLFFLANGAIVYHIVDSYSGGSLKVER